MNETLGTKNASGFVARVVGALVASVLLAWGVDVYANTPPAPFDATTATANALNGIVKSFGCNESIGLANAWTDALTSTAFAVDAANLTAGDAGQVRVVTVKLTKNDGTAAQWRGCVEVGGAAPALGCGAKDVVGNSGACSLLNEGDVCQWTVRPQTTACTTWNACHLPIWVRGSNATANRIGVSVAE